MEEVFKTIVGFENYEVSNIGNVRNIKRGNILKPMLDKDGYMIVNLYALKKMVTKKIHRIVCESFIENPDNKTCVDHIDNNRSNNNISNLRFATVAENSYNQKISLRNSSGCKGVHFKKQTNKWQAQIKIDGISIHLGSFQNKEDAIQCRINKANQVFGTYTNACEQINEI